MACLATPTGVLGEAAEDSEAAENNPPDTEPEPTSTLKTKKLSSVTLQSGIGKEWLSAEGGVSEFKGASNLGGLFAKGSRNITPEWKLELWAAAHNFTVVELGENETKVEQTKYLRLRTRAVGFYNPPKKFGISESHQILVGVGLETFKMPVLVLSDEDTGEAELASRNVIGPYIGIQYLKQTSDEHFFGAEFGFVPSVYGDARKGMSANGFAYWRFSFTEAIFSELGLAIRQDSLNHDISCPSSTVCRKKGYASSQILQGRMGIGCDF